MKPLSLKHSDACPCGSGLRLDRCCLDDDGRLRRQMASLTPPPPPTGYAHPNCYLSFTRNCSTDISGEHYISKAVLEAIGGPISVGGMPWLPEGTTREIGINSLTANILCGRHNSALSPLDTTVGQFFRALRNISVELKTKSLSRKVPMKLFAGEEIELWMLKALCGLFHAKLAASNRAILAKTHTLDHRRVEAALQLGLWGVGCGMYMNGNVGTGFRAENDFRFAPLTHSTEPRLCGGRFFIAGFEFDLIVDPTGINVQGLGAMLHRPSEMIFAKGQRRSAIFLSWPRGTPMRSINLELSNKPVPLGVLN